MLLDCFVPRNDGETCFVIASLRSNPGESMKIRRKVKKIIF